ncbi:putative phage tail protein [Clostridium algidicarnis]|uniref:putative phage tail protein n=1 Tax=Clostridium algidicarnis TaxID=37659 RepID=UPI001C0D7989|nr:YmfQ family protein [Clostridium algidicarnis]MBU3203139.1 YmfQ family protein [Clostridium algidicarnis]MBU3211293.1 YmfQ family protein [Clostridium algidicarnis]MBU3222199.1 YmfQ family protein [Clostridium algidicarnis]
MSKKLIEFLPPEITEIREFEEITSTEDIELELLEKGQQRILHENFIDSATDYGIKHKEKLFKIRADPSTESLDFRKLRLKNRKMDKMPITHRALEQKLKVLFGEGNYIIGVLNNEYVLKIEVNTFDWNMFYEIADNFRYIIPCNMILKSTLAQKISSKLYIGACTTIGEEITVYPWSLKDITSLGKVNIATGSNTGVESITIYPK